MDSQQKVAGLILPIVAYGDPVLKKVAADIRADHPGLRDLIDNMYATMYNAHGVGLAAPQVGQSIRLFVVDASPFAEDHPELDGFKKVFINPHILEDSGKEWAFNEGCLSLPGIREDVMRRPDIVLQYVDEQFRPHREAFSGLVARVIQHEHDHLDGILFTDRLSPLRRRLVKGKLTDISKGIVDAEYRMRFFSLRR
jgi:peptide deformylase